MGIVNRLVANKYLRTLKKGASANAKTLTDAKDHLVEIGPKVIPSVLELLPLPEARESALEVLDRLLTNETLPTYIQALGSDRAISTRVTQVLSMSQNYDAWRLLDHLSGSAPVRSRIEGILKARGSSVPERVTRPPRRVPRCEW